MKKILVTGANGFVGYHLINKLLADPNNEIVASGRNLEILQSLYTASAERISFIKLDLVNTSLCELPSDLDVVIHTAGLVHSYHENDFYLHNTEGTKNLIVLLKKKYSQLKINFILISSLAAAGSSDDMSAPKSTLDKNYPVSDYGRSKNLAEMTLLEMAPLTWITTIIRPPMVIGPKDQAVLDIFKMVKSKVVLLPGLDSLSKSYSFVCVHDLVNTIIGAIQNDKSYTLYSTFPTQITFKGLIELIASKMNIKYFIYLPIPLFIIRPIALLLKILFKLGIKHQLRLTPDKIFELEQKNFTCQILESDINGKQEFHYNIERTIDITLQDYQNRGWV